MRHRQLAAEHFAQRSMSDVQSLTQCATANSLQNIAVPNAFIHLSISLQNDLDDPVFDGMRLAGFKRRANGFLLASTDLILFVF